MGVLHVGQCMGMGGRAHTGLVGKEAPLGALADSDLQRGAQTAADDGVGCKRIAEDHAEGSGQVLDAHHQHHQAAQQEHSGHNGHQLLRDGSQALHAAQEDHRADDYQHHAHDPGGDAESRFKGGTDGVGLHHAAKEAQS